MSAWNIAKKTSLQNIQVSSTKTRGTKIAKSQIIYLNHNFGPLKNNPVQKASVSIEKQ